MKGKRQTLILPVEFTQEELDEKRDRLCSAVLEHDSVEDEKKEVTKQFGERMKELRAEVRGLSKSIKRRAEERPVDCIVKFHDPGVGFKTTIRLDSGEVIKTEAMTDDERQDNLFEEVDELNKLLDRPDTRANGEAGASA